MDVKNDKAKFFSQSLDTLYGERYNGIVEFKVKERLGSLDWPLLQQLHKIKVKGQCALTLLCYTYI